MPTPNPMPDSNPRLNATSEPNAMSTSNALPALVTEPNLAAPDDFYEQLIAMHRDLDDADSALCNARLILLLANHIGDAAVLRQAMAAARNGLPQSRTGHP
jgi:3-(3-hydroxy-phenyl)propionate hydroxylase